MKLKLLIADDEKEARQLIVHYIEEGNYDVSIREASDGKQTLDLLNKAETDILFLDIKMPEMNGIDVLNHRPGSPLPVVIFTTAYDEYALPAFDLQALDYLLKPFEKIRFDKAMQRAADYVSYIRNQVKREYITNLPFKRGLKTELVPVEEVVFFQSEGTYVRVHTDKQNFLISDPVYELETRLNPEVFIRIHRSVIVNKHFIKALNSLMNGDHQVILVNGKELRASRTYRDTIRKIKNPAG